MINVARNRAGDPLIRKLALNIISDQKIPSNNYIDEALALGDYIKNTVRYVRDPSGIEYLQDPLTIISQMQAGEACGDCDDMALLVAALLLSVGHEPSFAAVRYQDVQGPYNHIYVVDYDHNQQGPNQRIVLDAILKDRPIGFEVQSMSGDEFPI